MGLGLRRGSGGWPIPLVPVAEESKFQDAGAPGSGVVDKRQLSEADIWAKFITPAIRRAGWDEHTQIRREVHFTKGQIHVRGKMVARGKSKFADYVLYYKPNIPIAIIEAKDNNHSVGDGMQQALEYAEILNIPFVFSSNGDGFVFHDRTGTLPEVESTLRARCVPIARRGCGRSTASGRACPTKQELSSSRTTSTTAAGAKPRYYQRNAINAATEAIAKGQDRVLLVMATGTGKTYTAFQIIWRLWKAGTQEARPLPRRPQRPHRPDDGQRLPAVQGRDGEAQHALEDDRGRGRRNRRIATSPSTRSGGSTRPTRSTSASTRRSPARRSGRSSSASSRPASST